MPDTVQTTESRLASRITELVLSDKVQLPPLPQVVLKARDLLASEQFSMRALGALLADDAGMAAALMRLANSAAFGGMGRVESLSGAIQRIGQRQVSAMITGIGLKNHFRSDDPAKARVLQILWDHSVTSAFAARAIAGRIGLDAERAFLAGLMHDCGKVLTLAAIEAIERSGDAHAVSSEVTRELMNALHCELGHRVLVEWKLPNDVAQVALLHHEQAHAGQDLLLVVQAANLITRRLGFHPEPDPSLSVMENPVIEELGLTDLQVASLMIDMEDHLTEMKQLF
jgi:putative nucleotidyltransferase with HDIG domain